MVGEVLLCLRYAIPEDGDYSLSRILKCNLVSVAKLAVESMLSICKLINPPCGARVGFASRRVVAP